VYINVPKEVFQCKTIEHKSIFKRNTEVKAPNFIKVWHSYYYYFAFHRNRPYI
jgi:hypothetical protein